jgi:hypothetical protein
LIRLEKVYCGSIGAEYMHLHDLDQVNWIRQKLETPGALELDKDEKRLLLARYLYLLNILTTQLIVRIRLWALGSGSKNGKTNKKRG